MAVAVPPNDEDAVTVNCSLATFPLPVQPARLMIAVCPYERNKLPELGATSTAPLQEPPTVAGALPEPPTVHVTVDDVVLRFCTVKLQLWLFVREQFCEVGEMLIPVPVVPVVPVG